jgi:hypothetical protein
LIEESDFIDGIVDCMENNIVKNTIIISIVVLLWVDRGM